jgi:hypothetical protein
MVAPTGLLDRGCGLGWSALSWVVVGGWWARGGILRVAQNDKAILVGGDEGWEVWEGQAWGSVCAMLVSLLIDVAEPFSDGGCVIERTLGAPTGQSNS